MRLLVLPQRHNYIKFIKLSKSAYTNLFWICEYATKIYKKYLNLDLK